MQNCNGQELRKPFIILRTSNVEKINEVLVLYANAVVVCKMIILRKELMREYVQQLI